MSRCDRTPDNIAVDNREIGMELGFLLTKKKCESMSTTRGQSFRFDPRVAVVEPAGNVASHDGTRCNFCSM